MSYIGHEYFSADAIDKIIIRANETFMLEERYMDDPRAMVNLN